MDKKLYQKKFDDMKQEANTWTVSYRDISDYIAPHRGFFSAQPNQGKLPNFQKIIDGTPVRDLKTLASGLMSGLTSPSRPWFKLGLPDEGLVGYKPVASWLALVQERMMSVFAKSNIYSSLYSLYEELGSFSTGTMAVLEDWKDVIRARNFTAGEYYLTIGVDGRVNGFARDYWRTVNQLVAEFGLENCSSNVQNLYESNNKEQWIQCIHLIEENRDHYNKILKPWISIYWESNTNEDKFLKITGFDDFPILAPRWSVTTTMDIYGRGPGWDALGDVKMLQKLQKSKLLGVDKSIDPPIQVDGSVIGEPNTLPGGVSRFSATLPNAGIKTAYSINLDLNAVQAAILETQNSIGKFFYRDLFLMLSQIDRSNMTAFEVSRRFEEKLLMLGPILERLEDELLDPLIDRTFNIMNRVGLIPQAPEELQGMDLKVEYISTLAQAQKMVGTTSIEQVSAYVGNIAALDPTVLDVFNTQKAVSEYARLTGISPDIIRSDEEIAQLREQRAQAQQQSQLLPELATAAQGAKTLSETSLGNNSALDALMGTGGAS